MDAVESDLNAHSISFYSDPVISVFSAAPHDLLCFCDLVALFDRHCT